MTIDERKYKPGDIIKLTEPEMRILKEIRERIRRFDYAFELTMRESLAANDDLWKQLDTFYPDTEGYLKSIRWDDGEVVIKRYHSSSETRPVPGSNEE